MADEKIVKILCVDDEEELLEIYENILQGLQDKLSKGNWKYEGTPAIPLETIKFKLKTCTNGTDALAEFEKVEIEVTNREWRDRV